MELVALLLASASVAAVVSAALVSAACIRVQRARRRSLAVTDIEAGKTGGEPHGKLVRPFTWPEIESLTGGFSPAALIGEGGFSTVYIARLSDGSPAAVKLHRGGELLHRGFRHELDVLLRVRRHPRVVRLLGFCDDGREGVLVFEYLENGSLRDKLHGGGGGGECLPWGSRMRIAYGLAEALEYLHEGCDPQIVHGDVTAANVLLDGAMEPKLCDFGSAVVGFSAAVRAASAAAVGSPGYTDPHYLRTGLVSRKSDVYGFGVVALELITGVRAFEEGAPALAARAAGRGAAELVDPRLRGEHDAAEAEAVVGLAARCVGEQPTLRPSMAEVLRVMRESVPSAAGDWRRQTGGRDDNEFCSN